MNRDLIESSGLRQGCRHVRTKSQVCVTAERLASLLAQCCERAEAALSRSAEAEGTLHKSKSRFLLMATRAVDRELKEKLSLVERHRGKLKTLLGEFNQQTQDLYTGQPSKVSVVLAKDRLDKSLEVLTEEESKLAVIDIDLEVVSKKTLESLTRRSSRAQSPVPKECQYLSTSTCQFPLLKESTVHKQPSFGDFDQSSLTSDAKSQLLNALDGTMNLELYNSEMQHLHMENQLTLEENKKLQRQLIQLNITLDRFESQYNTLKEEYWQLKLPPRSDSLLQSWTEDETDWKTKAHTLEQELLTLKQLAPLAFYERQVDNIKTIYTDRYNELFKLTSVQIRKLEEQLATAQNANSATVQAETSRVRRTEETKRERDLDRLKRMHLRERETAQAETDELLGRLKSGLQAAAKKLTALGEPVPELERLIKLILAKQGAKAGLPKHRRCKSSSASFSSFPASGASADNTARLDGFGWNAQGDSSATTLLDQYLSSYY